MGDFSVQTRRHDFDWLRVLAFALLIYFHSAMPFIPNGIPLIDNDEYSLVLRVFVVFLHQFRLALLFFVSGIGAMFATRRRGTGAFVRERSRRLLLPLAFGIAVLVPPMVFLEKVHIGAYSGSFTSFYPTFYTQGVFPEGNLSWHHFWFLAYLFAYCVGGYPVISFLKSATGKRALDIVAGRMSSGLGAYLPIAPMSMVEIALRASFPGFPTFVDDWANVALWYLVFLAGFMFASSAQLLSRAEVLRFRSLLLAIVLSLTLLLGFWDVEGGVRIPDPADGEAYRYLAFCILRAGNIWCWILACSGYASRYLNRPSPMLTYLNKAVYPLFCLHLPAIVLFSFYAVRMDAPVMLKYFLISTGTVLACFTCYEVVRRYLPWMGAVIGARGKGPVEIPH